MPKIKIISDIHMGVSNNDANDCHFNDDEISAYLIMMLERYEYVVLNGDIFECWEINLDKWKPDYCSKCPSQSFDAWHKAMEKEIFHGIKPHYPKTIALIEKNDQIIYINGNHDTSCRTEKLIEGAQAYWIAGNDQFPIYIAHGHQGDRYNRASSSCMGRFCACLFSAGEQLIDPSLDDRASKLESRLNAYFRRDSHTMLVDHAEDMLKQYNYACVVYGHTHTPVLETYNNEQGIYANTGCVRGKDSFIDEVVLSYDDEKLEVFLQQCDFRTGVEEITKSLAITKNEFGRYLIAAPEQQLDGNRAANRI